MAIAAPTSRSVKAPLRRLLTMTFLGSMSSGVFSQGLFFVSAGPYGFSPARNLALGTIVGAVATLGAWSSAAVARRWAPRRVALAAWGLWAAVALLPVLVPRAEALLWFTALVGAGASAMIWPIIESYVSAGRHGADMREAIGLFNITWTPATAVPLLLMPLLGRLSGTASLGLAALVNVLAMTFAATLASHPGTHGLEEARAATGAEYPWLARAGTWLLPASYVLSNLMSPLLPFRLRAFGLTSSASAVAALWMAARFFTFLVMWRSGFWHGRWGTLAAGGVGLTAGLVAILLGSSLPIVLTGLAVFGVGMGLVYFASLYYSLTVGHAAVDAGGKFEALVGLGSSIGPLLGLGGHALGGGSEGPTVALAALVIAAILPGVLLPYRQARRRRPRATRG